LVPVTKAPIPEAPDGGHSSHAGMLLDAVPVALPDDPAERAEDKDVAGVERDALDGVLLVPPADPELGAAALEVDAVAVVPVVVDGVG
jgi:hypothetical protein